MKLHRLDFKLSPFSSYALAVSIFFVALFLRFLIASAELGYPFVTFYPAIVITFYICGIRPGMLVTALCALFSDYFFIPPYQSFLISKEGCFAEATFLFSACLIGLIIYELRRYAKQSRDLFENSFTGMIAVAPSTGRILQANQNALNMWGYDADEFLTKTLDELTYPDDLLESKKRNEQLAKGLIDNIRFEIRYLRKDSSYFWVEASVSTLKDVSGKVNLFIGNMTDITERKHIENALRDSEARFRIMLENDLMGIVSVKDRTIQWANPAFEKMLGYQKNEASGVPTRQHYLSDEAYEHFEQNAYQVINEGKLYRADIEYRRKDGSTIYVDLNGTLLNTETGESLWGFVDITERKQAEIDLKNENDKYSALLRNASDGIHVLDTEGNVIEVSDSFCNMLGYRRDEIIGMNVSQWDAQFNDEELKIRVRKQSEQRQPVQFETRHRRSDGTVIDVEIRGDCFDLNGNKVIFYSSRNITERKQAQDQIHILMNEQKAILDNDVVGIVKLRGRAIVWVNRGFENLLGYRSSELIGTTTRRFFNNQAEYEEMGSRAYPIIQAGERFRGEHKYLCKDGSIIWAEINAGLIDREKNESLWVMLEITERKRTEDALRESENRLRVMLENGIVGIIRVKDRIIQWTNPAIENLLGYDKGELNGVSARLIYPDEEAFRATGEQAYPAILAGKIFRTELVFKRKDGSHITVDASCGVLNLESGESLWTCVDITERKLTEERIKHLANYDRLTDLPNRSLVDDRMHQALATAKRDKTLTALFFLDLDRFKPINDTFGHDVGDLLLKEVARRIQECVRESDTVGRIGGDEFIVLLPAVDSAQDAVLVAEKIRQALNQPFAVSGKNLYISSSTGVAIYPEHGDDAKELVKNADTAMYFAKEAGRDTVLLFKPQMIGSQL